MKPVWENIVDLMPIGIIVAKVNTVSPDESILVYCNRHASKEIGIDLKKYLNKTMPDILVSKKGLLDKYVQAVEIKKTRKLVARLREKNTESNFSIVLLPVGEDYVAAIYQRIDDKIKAIELSKELDQKTEELEDKKEAIQELMSELKEISVRIKKNGYK